MSAHWYWDWDWGRKDDKGGAGRGGGDGRERDAAKEAPHAEHKPDPLRDIPEEVKYIPRGPCRKIARYIGKVMPGPNDKPPVIPHGVTWKMLVLEELDCDDHHFPNSPDIEYYWVACEPAAYGCCPGKKGCELYETRVRLPQLKEGDPPRFIRDFKCKCHNS